MFTERPPGEPCEPAGNANGAETLDTYFATLTHTGFPPDEGHDTAPDGKVIVAETSSSRTWLLGTSCHCSQRYVVASVPACVVVFTTSSERTVNPAVVSSVGRQTTAPDETCLVRLITARPACASAAATRPATTSPPSM